VREHSPSLSPPCFTRPVLASSSPFLPPFKRAWLVADSAVKPCSGFLLFFATTLLCVTSRFSCSFFRSCHVMCHVHSHARYSPSFDGLFVLFWWIFPSIYSRVCVSSVFLQSPTVDTSVCLRHCVPDRRLGSVCLSTCPSVVRIKTKFVRCVEFVCLVVVGSDWPRLAWHRVLGAVCDCYKPQRSGSRVCCIRCASARSCRVSSGRGGRVVAPRILVGIAWSLLEGSL